MQLHYYKCSFGYWSYARIRQDQVSPNDQPTKIWCLLNLSSRRFAIHDSWYGKRIQVNRKSKSTASRHLSLRISCQVAGAKMLPLHPSKLSFTMRIWKSWMIKHLISHGVPTERVLCWNWKFMILWKFHRSNWVQLTKLSWYMWNLPLMNQCSCVAEVYRDWTASLKKILKFSTWKCDIDLYGGFNLNKRPRFARFWRIFFFWPDFNISCHM